MLLEQMLLLAKTKDPSYSLFLLFIQILFLFFNRLLLVFSKDVLRLFVRQLIAGHLLLIIFGTTTG
jgi:hypothetical protein